MGFPIIDNHFDGSITGVIWSIINPLSNKLFNDMCNINVMRSESCAYYPEKFIYVSVINNGKFTCFVPTCKYVCIYKYIAVDLTGNNTSLWFSIHEFPIFKRNENKL